MSIDERVHRLILSAYDAALQRTSWTDVSRLMAEHLGAYGVTSVLHRTDRNEILASAMVGYRDVPFDEILSEYAAEFHHRNPQALFERARPTALHYFDGIDPIYNADNYPDFSRWEQSRIGIRYHATAYCRPAQGLTYAFAVSGSSSAGPFSSGDLELFRCLTEHIRRAVEVAHRLGTLETQKVQLESILDGLLETNPRGVAILDGRGQPVFVNGAMLAIVRERDGILLDAVRLRTGCPADDQRFRQLCASATRLVAGEAQGGGTMAVSRPSGRRSYIVTVSPLPPQKHLLADPGGKVLVTIVDPERRVQIVAEHLVNALGLTPAEARVAAALSRGDAVEAIAAAAGISVGTVRSCLKAIFAKTGTSRQAELVALVARIN